MRSTPCRVCGVESGRSFYAFDYHWSRCPSCHTIQKLMTAEEYRQLNPGYDAGHYLDGLSARELEKHLEVADKVELLRALFGRAAHPEDKLKYLDVGSGMGAFMLAARHLGFEVAGFEPSADHARIATEVLGLPVTNDYFSPERARERYDLITLSHVIEHIYDPGPFLDGLVSVLRPGGLLVVITPNAASTLARLCGAYWPMLKPADHVSMLSADSYRYFRFSRPVTVAHEWSGYPFEFAATALSAVRARVRGERSSSHANASASPLKRRAWWRPALMAGLTVASLPAMALPRPSRPCLITTIRADA